MAVIFVQYFIDYPHYVSCKNTTYNSAENPDKEICNLRHSITLLSQQGYLWQTECLHSDVTKPPNHLYLAVIKMLASTLSSLYMADIGLSTYISSGLLTPLQFFSTSFLGTMIK